MPATVLTTDANVQCPHGATAKATSPQPRVKIAGAPIVTIASSYQVSGCPNANNPSPCQTGQFVSAATRLKSGGQPLLLQSASSTSVPTGSPLVVAATQQRVKGS
jgi:hypothetical protein